MEKEGVHTKKFSLHQEVLSKRVRTLYRESTVVFSRPFFLAMRTQTFSSRWPIWIVIIAAHTALTRTYMKKTDLSLNGRTHVVLDRGGGNRWQLGRSLFFHSCCFRSVFLGQLIVSRGPGEGAGDGHCLRAPRRRAQRR